MDLFGKSQKSRHPGAADPLLKFIDLSLCETPVKARISGDSVHLVCLTVMRELGNKASQIYLRNRLKKSELPLQQLVPTHTWNPVTKCCDEEVHTESDYCVSLDNLRSFIEWTQVNTRQTRAEKERRFAKFGIVLEPDQIKVPVEIDMLDKLQQACPYKIEFQHRIGKYRVDAWIERLRLVIQIDEHGHSAYDQKDEKEMEQVIRDNNMVLIRFNPHGKYLYPPDMELIRIIWERTLSPDYTAFRDKCKLI